MKALKAHRIALGTTYYYDNWTFPAAGIAFDDSPVPPAQNRSISIPDEDRFWLTPVRLTPLTNASVDVGVSCMVRA